MAGSPRLTAAFEELQRALARRETARQVFDLQMVDGAGADVEHAQQAYNCAAGELATHRAA